SESLQPFHDVLRVGDAAAEQEQLRVRRGEGDGEVVIEAAVFVANHLVLVHNEQDGAVALDQAVLLRFQRGDNDRRVQVVGEVASGNADVPAASAPFSEFVIGERAGG